MNQFSKKISITAISIASTTMAHANTQAHDSSFTIDTNTVLIACAALLFLVIIVLGNTLRSAIYFYHQKRKRDAKTDTISGKISILILGLLMASSFPSFAQESLPVAVSEGNTILDASILSWIIYFVLSMEIVVIFLFANLIRFFTGVEALHKAEAKNRWITYDAKAFWTKINRLRPIEEEALLDTGHSYDGIRELNNATPPWFIAGFAISILCAGAYMWRYHIAASAPLQIEEYTIEVAEAKLKIDEYLKTQANNVDENTVVVLGEDAITAGQALFASNCVACHGDKGQGASVGPNLSDNFWLHKGGIKDIFKSIKYGWQEKGMKAWKDDFSATQIAQLASYIHSLKGSNQPGAKEAQGELYEEKVSDAKADTSSKQ